MVKRRRVINEVKKTFSLGYGELKKDVKSSYNKLKPKLKKKLKKKYKCKSSKQIKKTLGYDCKLNLGEIY